MTVTKGAVNRISVADRQRQALELRRAGATLQQIADRLGFAHPSGAANAIASGLKKTLQAPADELRALDEAASETTGLDTGSACCRIRHEPVVYHGS
jgi:hypothetical protein